MRDDGLLADRQIREFLYRPGKDCEMKCNVMDSTDQGLSKFRLGCDCQSASALTCLG